MAKRNKPEMHFRLKPYLVKWILQIAEQTQSTMTTVVEDALEKGLSWRIKMIRKELDPNFMQKPEQAQVQKHNKTKPEKPKEPDEDEEPTPSNEEIKRMVAELYAKK